MMRAEDELHFLDESIGETAGVQKPWKLLIVDDDPGVHAVTKLALANLRFEGRGLEFISAFSSVEARQIIAFHPDAAVVLLDVVMETEDAGLELARFIREDLHNNAVRIILRTGQPGQVPEAQVVVQYDINDYKTKTELTSQRLFTSVITALRGFRDIREIHATKKGLEQIVHAALKLLECRDPRQFARETLEQLTALMHLERSTYYSPASGFLAMHEAAGYRAVAAVGELANVSGELIKTVLPKPMMAAIERAAAEKAHVTDGPWLIFAIEPTLADPCLIVMESVRVLDDWEKSVLEIFAANVTAICANLACRAVTHP